MNRLTSFKTDLDPRKSREFPFFLKKKPLKFFIQRSFQGFSEVQDPRVQRSDPNSKLLQGRFNRRNDFGIVGFHTGAKAGENFAIFTDQKLLEVPFDRTG